MKARTPRIPKAVVEEVLYLLIRALPYVEEEESSPAYKRDDSFKLTPRIRAAIARAAGEG